MLLAILSVVCGLASAAAWFYASRVKVTREQALEQRRRAAAKSGKEPYLGGMTFDGAEMRETLAAQSKWNSVGAVLAAIAVASQSLAQVLAHV
jgi:hypothetical protein